MCGSRFIKYLVTLLFFLSYSYCSIWESPETLFNSLKVPDKEGDYIKCSGLAISPLTGDLYFSDESLGKIFRLFNGEVQLVAGTGLLGYKDGPFISAQFGYLSGMAFGPNASFLLVADYGNEVIRLLDFETGSVSTIAGVPNQYGMADGMRAKFNGPRDVVVDYSGIFAFVTDFYNHRIRKIDLKNGYVSTVAGTGLNIFNGDEGPAIKVNLYYPTSIIYKESSNLLFFTDANCAVKMVNGTGYLTTLLRDCSVIPRPLGIVEKDNNTILVSDFIRNVIVSIDINTSSSSIFAGSSSAGFFDGLRLDASFSAPLFMAVDKGDVYISDYYNTAIRKISKSGYVSTEVKTTGSGLEDGYMGQARFNSPSYLALDEIKSILYVSDTSNHAIRRIYLNENYKVNVLTGKPYGGYLDGSLDTALFSHPRTLLLNQRNNNYILYICDSGNSVIRAVNLNNNSVKSTKKLSDRYSTIVIKEGNVIEVPYVYGTPSSATWLDNNTLIISINYLNSIWRVEWKNGLLYYNILAGDLNYVSGYKDGDAMSAKFNYPVGITLFNETIFIADSYNYVIRSLDLSKSLVSTYFGSGKNGHRNGPSFISEFKAPYDIKMDINGTLYIVDEQAHAIRMIKDGIMETIAGFGAKAPQYDFKEFVFGFECLARISEMQLIISDKRNNVIFTLNSNGTVNNIKPMIGSGMIGFKDGIGLESMLKAPTDMAFSSSNSVLYIADSGNHAIRSYDMKSGNLSTLVTALNFKQSPKINLNNPQGIALDTLENKLFISDTDNHGIKVLDLASNTLSLVAGSRASNAGFKSSWFGEFAAFANPIGIAVSMKDKVIYVCDSYNHAIRRVLYNGTVTTLANVNGLPGYLDGDLSNSKMLYPTKIALSSSKNMIYILDSGNYRIRVINLKSETMETVMDTQAWPIHGIHFDNFDNLYANSRKSVKMFKNLISNTKPNVSNALSSTQIMLVTLICITFSMSLIILYFISSRRRAAQKAKTLPTVRLSILSQAHGHNGGQTRTVNLENTTRSISFTIPDYLKLTLDSTVIYDMRRPMIDRRAAKIYMGLLKRQDMVKRFGGDQAIVKVFKPGEESSYRMELKIMCNLPRVPGIVQFIGYHELPPTRAFITRYCQQSDQANGVEDLKSHNIEKYIIQVGNAMKALHEKGIVLFGLCPKALYYDKARESCIIWDFSFAAFFEDAAMLVKKGQRIPTSSTEGGISIRYSAPELFPSYQREEEEVTVEADLESKLPKTYPERKVDVYSYGMLVYRLVYQIEPFSEIQEESKINSFNGNRPKLTSKTKWNEMIKNCWSQSPRLRPSFAEIAASFEGTPID